MRRRFVDAGKYALTLKADKDKLSVTVKEVSSGAYVVVKLDEDKTREVVEFIEDAISEGNG